MTTHLHDQGVHNFQALLHPFMNVAAHMALHEASAIRLLTQWCDTVGAYEQDVRLSEFSQKTMVTRHSIAANNTGEEAAV